MRSQFCSGRKVLLAVCILLSIVLAGCGGNTSSGCRILSLNVSPNASAVNHNAAAPGNTQQFDAFAGSTTPNCAVAQSNLTTVTWSVSDPVNTTIGTTPGLSYGVATCKAATSGAVTVTATLSQTDFAPVTGTASLTCN